MDMQKVKKMHFLKQWIQFPEMMKFFRFGELMSKFFYITFSGIPKPDAEENTIDQNFSQSRANGYVILPLPGFIPDMIVDLIKKDTSLDNILINGCIEMSQQDVLMNAEYKENKYKLDKGVVDEIDSLVTQTESGKLRVMLDPDSDKPFDDDPFQAGDFFK